MDATPAIHLAVPEVAPEQPAQLVFDIPGPEVPGFLRRQRAAAEHLAAFRGNRRGPGGRPVLPTPADYDELVTFLLGFVGEPLDRDQARELLLDMGRDQYNKLLTAVLAENDSFLRSNQPNSDS